MGKLFKQKLLISVLGIFLLDTETYQFFLFQPDISNNWCFP